MKPFRTISLNVSSMPLKYVTFSGFKGLEYHVTPEASIVFYNIYSRGKELAPASFLVDQGAPEDLIESRVLARQSKERVKKTFENDFMSASMTEDEMSAFAQLMNAESFISHKVIFVYEGTEYDYLYEMDKSKQEIFQPYIEQLSLEMVLDDKENEERAFQVLQDQIYQTAYNSFLDDKTKESAGIKTEKDKEKEEANKKRDRKIFVSAFLFMSVSIVLGVIEKLLSRKSLKGIIFKVTLKGFAKMFGAMSVAKVGQFMNNIYGRAVRV